MTRGDVIQLIAGRVHRQNVLVQARAEVNLAQSEMEGMLDALPWFLVRRDATLVASSDTLTGPADFICMYEEGGLWVTDTDGVEYEVVKKGLAELKNLSAAGDIPTTPSRPLYYAHYGVLLYLFPTPDQEYPFTMYYYGHAQPLLDDEERNEWTENAPDVLAALAGYRTARYLRDHEAAQLMQQDLVVATRRVGIEAVARAATAQTVRLGG